MGKVKVSEKTKILLWGKAAGRCQYSGCNKPMWEDQVTKAEFNNAYVAHIIASSSNGPRGNKELSPALVDDLDNLMLLCDSHHRLIDKEDVEGHPVDYLHAMKKAHEDRMRIVSGIDQGKDTQLIIYGANIGTQAALCDENESQQAVLPNRYPNGDAIVISVKNHSIPDDDDMFCGFEEKNLVTNFQRYVEPLISNGHVSHFSFFGIAPQFLLIKAGTLLNELRAVDVYQKQREWMPSWSWPRDGENIDFNVSTNDKSGKDVALIFSISDQVNDERVTNIMGENIPIWRVGIDQPNKDCVRSIQTQRNFREVARNIYGQIKAAHGEDVVIHVFPAMPNSLAVEFGRVRMPKADLPLVIYDQMTKGGVRGFYEALSIGLNDS